MGTGLENKFRLGQKMLRYVGWSLVWLLIWDVIVTVDYMFFLDRKIKLPNLPLTLLGSALVVLTSFRNSSAYARWWEARTLWGTMVNSSRSFGRQVLTLIDDGNGQNPLKAVLLRRHVAYVRCLAAHLRGEPMPDSVEALLTPSEFARRQQTKNYPNDILNFTAGLIAQEYKAGRLDSIRLARIESTLVDISNAQGGMERIANTPLPYPYVAFPRLFITLFCMIVPVGLVETLEWYTPLASTVVGFMLLAIERIGTDLQSPFQPSEHQIRTEELCSNIEGNLLTMLRDAQRVGAAQGEGA
ncbi:MULTISPECIES: bestrophin family protein [unclassified Pseudomonas]|uniref:bestrophin family protein n=1 Tax=unclassified Pseudomonas TaxID=196821 RepID=UPI000BD71488|nr:MULTISPECIES: bestrophin family ion channel [unclassified Pseudomonas]PVZ10482.1 putative membrane protein [Pseudomonas sp. URIL14HWK12:I12]PVZ21908.1 putative membrane protein [Pseudomonas sp. URIL14HWK12:I10]PVZ31009.1 putative membrane protein [Pseudomonas sp. URIL14HWK12:I11]SNZ17536.1 putative membrane protein [Pseudomonas sp. URIL14HWK12:I9]